MYSARCGDQWAAPRRAPETEPDDESTAPDGIKSAEDWLDRSLNKAGASMLALPYDREMPAGFRVAWPDYRHSAAEAYGCGKVRLRGAAPTSAQISAMDRAYGWVELLVGDDDQIVRWRRIFCLRSLCDPVTRRHMYSWERVADAIGYSRTWCQREHQLALRLICALIAAGGRA